jgi:hypothetical protein
MQVQRINQTNFGRMPNSAEKYLYSSSLKKGLKLLDKQVDIIIHNSAAPAVEAENTGIGSLFSKTVQEKLIPFLREHGISGIQQEPNGLRKMGDPSPYAPESSAKNIFMIPLEKLTTKEYGKILPISVFKDIVSHGKLSESVNYQQANKDYDRALQIYWS